MQLGLGTYAYAWAIGAPGYPADKPMDGFAFLNRAKALGLHLVQIADNLPLHTLPVTELDALIKRGNEAQIAFEVGTRGIAHDHLLTYLQLAQRFHSPILRVVVDTADHHPSDDEVVRILHDHMLDFERAGICLAIENHDRFPVKVLASIIERLNSPYVGICLDTVNSFGSLEAPVTVVDVLGRHVVNLHVKDFTIRRLSHNLGFSIEGTPAGQGRLDVPWLIRTLHEKGRDPNAILELWPPPEEKLADTIAKEDRWVADSVTYLRTLIPA